MPGDQTLIPMKKASGGAPTQVNLPDATTIVPDATGQFMVPAAFLTTMLNAGFQMVVTGGATHVEEIVGGADARDVRGDARACKRLRQES